MTMLATRGNRVICFIYGEICYVPNLGDKDAPDDEIYPKPL